MNNGGPSSPLLNQVWQAALVIILTAVIARVAWELLRPVVPTLIVIGFFVLVLKLIIQGRRL